MKLFLSISIVLLTLEPRTCAGRGGGSRVFGGYPIDIFDAPWMAYVRYGNYEACGGTIVNEMFILTAAHCATTDVRGVLKTNDASLYKIRIGSSDLDKGGNIYKVAEVIPNRRYDRHSHANDVALLRLEKRIKYRKGVQNVRLDSSKGDYAGGEKVSGMGWGANPENPDTTELYEVDMNIVNTAECARTWGFPVKAFEKHIICAIGPKNADVCSGDSGGPLFNGNNEQIGVVGGGADCPQDGDGKPGVYAQITDNLDWINGIISGSGNKNTEDCTN